MEKANASTIEAQYFLLNCVLISCILCSSLCTKTKSEKQTLQTLPHIINLPCEKILAEHENHKKTHTSKTKMDGYVNVNFFWGGEIIKQDNDILYSLDPMSEVYVLKYM